MLFHTGQPRPPIEVRTGTGGVAAALAGVNDGLLARSQPEVAEPVDVPCFIPQVHPELECETMSPRTSHCHPDYFSLLDLPRAGQQRTHSAPAFRQLTISRSDAMEWPSVRHSVM